MKKSSKESFSTPILFLIFNRPEISRKVFNQIKKIRPGNLFIAADGPRPQNPDDIFLCTETRKIVDEIDWECDVKTLFRTKNMGCGPAVCSAINWFFEQVEEGIILEDDCFPDLSFFNFCNELLEKYRYDKQVYLISGTNMQNNILRGSSSYYFSNYPITWGWASWRRAWEKFDFDAKDYKQAFTSGELDHAFQLKQEKSYWFQKIKMIELEKRNIWDYQWFYSIWRNRGIAIVPNSNLIINIGFTNSGTHTFLKDSIREPSSLNTIIFPLMHPNQIVNKEADLFTFKNAFSHSISRFFRLIKENGFKKVLYYFLKKLHQSRH